MSTAIETSVTPQAKRAKKGSVEPTPTVVAQPNNEPRPKVPSFDSAEEVCLLLDRIDEGYNPRTTFSGLEELATSIREVGLLQAITVRPHGLMPSGAGDRFELVFGARRLRAAKLAGLETIRAKVVELTDEQADELRVIENNQREDLHPLQEAAGFERLIRHGRTTASIAERLGRSVEYVQKRMRVLSLEPEAREAFETGLMDFGVALVIARVPYRAGQLEALQVLVTGKRAEPSDTVATTRYAQQWVRQHLMLRLADAQFDTGDPTLVPAAGACTQCPKNTSQATALFSEVDKDALCTDALCHRSKLDAAFARRVALATTAKVLPKAEAKKVFSGYGEDTVYSSDFVSMADGPGRLGVYDTKAKSIGKLAKGKLDDVPKTLAQNPYTGTIHELVPKAAAQKIVEKPGSSSSSVSEAEKKRQADEKKKRALRSAELAARAQVAYDVLSTKAPTFRTLTRLMAASWSGARLLEHLPLAGVTVTAEEKKLDNAKRAVFWEKATKTMSEAQLAALYTLARSDLEQDTELGELERAYPGLGKRVEAAAKKAGDEAKVKAKETTATRSKAAKKASPKRRT